MINTEIYTSYNAITLREEAHSNLVFLTVIHVRATSYLNRSSTCLYAAQNQVGNLVLSRFWVRIWPYCISQR